jgi:calcineurin-like phosphoesterase family protein
MRDFFAITAPTATKAVFSNSIYLQLTADSNDRSSINSFSPINSHIPATMAETQPQVSAGNKISIVCLSDTHLKCPQVPDGDLLLHAGDFTSRGKFDEMQAQLDWLGALPHRHKVVVGGNHDRVLDPSYIAKHPKFDQGGKFEELDWHDITYLERTSVTLEFPDAGRSLRIYGCPLTPAYVAPKGGRGPYYSWAFLYDGKDHMWANTVPDDTDILLVHGPPKGHLDNDGKGCPHFLREVWRVRPPLVVFGHMHRSRGLETLHYDNWDTWAQDQINMRAKPPGVLSNFAVTRTRLKASTSQMLGRSVVGVANARRSTQLVNAADDEDLIANVLYL